MTKKTLYNSKYLPLLFEYELRLMIYLIVLSKQKRQLISQIKKCAIDILSFHDDLPFIYKYLLYTYNKISNQNFFFFFYFSASINFILLHIFNQWILFKSRPNTHHHDQFINKASYIYFNLTSKYIARILSPAYLEFN